MKVTAAKTQPASASHAAPAHKLPTKSQLNNILGAWAFQSRGSTKGVWHATVKPKDLKPTNILKQVVLEKPKPGVMGGPTITAYVLKNHPNMVIFEKTQALAPPNGHTWFGPVRNDIAPK